MAFRACELPSHGAYFTHANCRQLHLAAVVARAHEAPRPVVPLRRHRGFGRYPASSLPTTAPTKCLRSLDPLASFSVAPAATRGQRIAVLHLTEEPSWVIRSRELTPCPSVFFFRRFGPTPPDRSPYESDRAPTWVMRATFGHPPAEGPGTYARERDPGRGSATGSRKVVPPAGPSHLTPSRPGEAKSRSREAPRCPHQF